MVWEVTLGCNLRCLHCGSRAGKRRPNELTTAECLDVISQLAKLGTRQISLIGGEVYLRRDWLDILGAITDHGIDCSIQTGGRGLTHGMLEKAKARGLKSCGVSVDGLPIVHDRLRGWLGSFAQAFSVLGFLRELEIPSSVNTQISRESITQLRALFDRVVESGARGWQLQLTVPMGNAADSPELLIQPYELLELMPVIAELHEEAEGRGLVLQISNTLGYFGPFEHLLRITDDATGHWQGCAAGHTAMGLEADGTVKGCPSLPTKPYAAGNVRASSIADLWSASPVLGYTRTRTVDDLWGFCRTCMYADTCRAGCTWMSHVLFGRPGNNPYCHHRTLELRKRGVREKIVKVASAPGRPFDYGQFALVEEDDDGSTITSDPPDTKRIFPAEIPSSEARVPPALEVCRSCFEHVVGDPETCPHCGANMKIAADQHGQRLASARAATERLRKLLDVDSES